MSIASRSHSAERARGSFSSPWCLSQGGRQGGKQWLDGSRFSPRCNWRMLRQPGSCTAGCQNLLLPSSFAAQIRGMEHESGMRDWFWGRLVILQQFRQMLDGCLLGHQTPDGRACSFTDVACRWSSCLGSQLVHWSLARSSNSRESLTLGVDCCHDHLAEWPMRSTVQRQTLGCNADAMRVVSQKWEGSCQCMRVASLTC